MSPNLPVQAAKTSEFIRLLKHPVKSRLFLLGRLPSAFFAGVRVLQIDRDSCTTCVPYKWFSRNPFRSTYFACLGMAAEMSTGALAISHLYKRNPMVSMLVMKVDSEYFKKATKNTFFVCEDGEQLRSAIDEAIISGEARQFRAHSVGKNEQGELIAEFYITWSFKVKPPR